MTEDEKAREVKRILAVADYAENTGLIATAKNWRDYAMNVAARPANEIVFANKTGKIDGNRVSHG